MNPSFSAVNRNNIWSFSAPCCPNHPLCATWSSNYRLNNRIIKLIPGRLVANVPAGVEFTRPPRVPSMGCPLFTNPTRAIIQWLTWVVVMGVGGWFLKRQCHGHKFTHFDRFIAGECRLTTTFVRTCSRRRRSRRAARGGEEGREEVPILSVWTESAGAYVRRPSNGKVVDLTDRRVDNNKLLNGDDVNY